MLGSWLVDLDAIELGIDDSNALWFWDDKPLGKTIGALDGFPLGTYDGTELGCSEVSTEGTADGYFRVCC